MADSIDNNIETNIPQLTPIVKLKLPEVRDYYVKYAKENFSSYYNSLVTEVADIGKVLNNMVTNQTTMTDGYNGQRLQTAGVSSDEELQNMIKFQQAYNAASRYVNVVSQMLEQIVTRLGN